MEPFVQGWGLTIVLCAFIVLVFFAGWLHVHRELSWVRALTDYLGEGLVLPDVGEIDAGGSGNKPASLEVEMIRDESHAIVHASDPAWAQKQVRSWQMRAQRLEPTLAFWTDLLRQLGLLGTVLGLGLSLAYTGSDLTKLLAPLALKVWTTVAGLACSILLSASFSMRLTAWVDACEKNLEAWDARRRVRPDGLPDGRAGDRPGDQVDPRSGVRRGSP